MVDSHPSFQIDFGSMMRHSSDFDVIAVAEAVEDDVYKAKLPCGFAFANTAIPWSACGCCC
eukprot:10104698-Prorocentrum_lima.AAC.1